MEEIRAMVQPQATELEELILGAILLEEHAMNEVVQFLDSDYFYKDSHQRIFEAAKNINDSSGKLDMYTLTEQLRKNGDLENCGGVYYVASLTNKVASSAHIVSHAQIIAEKYFRRKLISQSSEMIRDLFDDTTDVFDTIYNNINVNTEMIQRKDVAEPESLRSIIIENHKQRLKGNTGLYCKFNDINELTNGWQESDLIIVAARPSMGKTTFVINDAVFMSQYTSVAFFSLEMSKAKIVSKIESLETKINSYRIQQNNIYENEREKYDALKKINYNLHIDDTSGLKLQDLKAKLIKLKNKHDVKIAFIDYLQLMQGTGKGNREQDISEITRGLKQIAKDLKMPIVALSQLSRAVENRPDKRPQLSDLRESGSIEQDADVVLFLFRPYYYAERTGDLSLMEATDDKLVQAFIQKNRMGALGNIDLQCNLKISEIKNKPKSSGDFVKDDLANEFNDEKNDDAPF